MLGLRADMKTEREPGRVLTRSALCFQSRSYGEISANAIKLVGSAQKRWSDGFLQQGSIPYSIDRQKIEAVFGLNGAELTGLRELVPDFKPEDFKKCLRLSFEKHFTVSFVDSHPSPQEQELALQLSAGKYRGPQWTRELEKGRRFCNRSGIRKKA